MVSGCLRVNINPLLLVLLTLLEYVAVAGDRLAIARQLLFDVQPAELDGAMGHLAHNRRVWLLHFHSRRCTIICSYTNL